MTRHGSVGQAPLPLQPRGQTAMADAVMLLIAVIFFILSFALIRWFDQV